MTHLDTHTAIIGASGSGKTVTAKGDVEVLLAEHRHLAIIDPLGVWWGLRSAADGTAPGIDIPIFGGDHGDVQILPEHGGAVGSYIAGGMSAIIDLSGMDQRDGRIFMLGFMRALRKKPKANFHLIVDEADEFAPQTAPDDYGFQLVEQMTWVAKRGRTAGFVLTVITQRPADISKAVLSQMQTIIAHQLVAPQDQKALDDYLKANGDPATRRTVMASLAGLDRGERWFYAPRAGVLERAISPLPFTFDSSRTPAPGEVIEEPKMLAAIDLGEIRAALAPPVADQVAAPDGQVNPADDQLSAQIGQLRARIAELEREGTNSALLAAERAKEIDRLHSVIAAYQNAFQAQCTLIADISWPSIERSDGTLPSEPLVIPSVVPKPTPALKDGAGSLTVEASRAPAPSTVQAKRPLGDLPKMTMKLVDVFAKFHPRSLSIEHAARIADVSMKSSAWRSYLRPFRESGLVEQMENHEWRLTELGVHTLGVTPAPDATDQLLDYWLNDLPPSVGAMLKLLVQANGEWVDRQTIASEAGISPTSSGLNSGLKELRDHGLVERRVDGHYHRATKVLL